MSTQSKVVTLTGTVDTNAAKDRAIALAREIEGVADVVDRIVVSGDAAAPTTGRAGEQPVPAEPGRTVGQVTDDASITTAVKGKLLADRTVSGLKIDVDTRAAVVTLTGTVDSETERTQAVTLARETAGVKEVVDRLVVRK